MQILKQSLEKEALLIILAFLISWAPFGLTYMTYLVGIDENDTERDSNVIPLLTVKFGSAMINPLVYNFENSEVKYLLNIYHKI